MLPRDKNGIEIMPGDLVKVFHFIGPRNKKNYMYKFVESTKNGRLRLSHLCLAEDGYSLTLNGEILPDYEIIQGYGKTGLDYFADRPKKVGE